MTAILTLTVLVLIGIAIWQIAKMFELSQTKEDNSQVANDKTTTYKEINVCFFSFIYILTLYSF